MGIFNASGGGILTNYIVKFSPEDELQLSNTENVIQIDTDLQKSRIIDEKEKLSSNIVYTKANSSDPTATATYDSGIIHSINNYFSEKEQEEEISKIYFCLDPIYVNNTEKFSIKKTNFKKIADNTTLTFTLSEIAQTMKAEDFIIAISNNNITTSTDNAAAFDITDKVSFAQENSTITFSVNVDEIKNIAGLTPLSSDNTYLYISTLDSTLKFNSKKCTSNSGWSSSVLAKGRFLKNSIFYSVYNKKGTCSKVKYVSILPNHVYCFKNKFDYVQSAQKPSFIWTSSKPEEGIIGNAITWNINSSATYWMADSNANYIAYSYYGTEPEPIIEEYTLEYYLPKLYPYEKEKWMAEWFREDIIIYSQTEFKEKELIYKYLYLNKADSIPATLDSISPTQINNEDDFNSAKNNNYNIFKIENGKEIHYTGEYYATATYCYYKEEKKYFYNPVIVDDWFNDNCINNWEFSNSRISQLKEKNKQGYSLFSLNRKVYWIETGNENYNQSFNLIKTDFNPIYGAVTGVYCYFDITPILSKLGIESPLKDKTVELVEVSLSSKIYLYDTQSQKHLKPIEIPSNEKSQVSLAAYIAGTLTYIADKNVNEVAENTFNGDLRLTGIDFPNCSIIRGSMTVDATKKTITANTYPFQNCTNLTTLKLPSWEPTDGQDIIGVNPHEDRSPFGRLPQLTTVACGIKNLADVEILTQTVNKVTTETGLKTTQFPFYSAHNNLQTIQISSCLYIGDKNFYKFYPALQEVSLYNNVSDDTNLIHIGNQAFYDCSNLKSINLTNVEYIGISAFQNCITLENIGTLNYATSIKNNAFKNCAQLDSLEALNCVNFGDANSEFNYADGNPLFGCTEINTLRLGVNKPLNNTYLNNFPKLEILDLPNVTSISGGIFTNKTVLKNINLNSLTEIPTNGFITCPNINCINFTSEMKTMVDDNIEEDNEKEITYNILSIPKVTTINSNAFQDCSGLNHIYFTEPITINNTAFSNCPNIQTINIENCNQGNYLNGAFKSFLGPKLQYLKLKNHSSNTWDGVIKMPILKYCEIDNILALPESTFEETSKLEEVHCNAVTTIGKSCFENSDRIIYINQFDDNLSNSIDMIYLNTPILNTISERAFCNDIIGKVYIPNLVSIGDNAFNITDKIGVTARTSGLQQLKIIPKDNSTPVLENKTFFAFTEAESLTIGAFAFANSQSLTSCELEPYNEITIGEAAFKNCFNKEKIDNTLLFKVKGNITLYSKSFADNPSVKTITFDCTNLDKEATIKIGSQAFSIENESTEITEIIFDFTAASQIPTLEIEEDAFLGRKMNQEGNKPILYYKNTVEINNIVYPTTHFKLEKKI